MTWNENRTCPNIVTVMGSACVFIPYMDIHNRIPQKYHGPH